MHKMRYFYRKIVKIAQLGALPSDSLASDGWGQGTLPPDPNVASGG